MAALFHRSSPGPPPDPVSPTALADPDRLLAVFGTGFWLCADCGSPIEFGLMEPLSIAPCPFCDRPVFVPLRVKTYYLYAPAGGGGMGSVYRAVCTEYPGETFAVKVLPRDQREDAAARAALEAEARVAARLYGVPNCERAVEYGSADGEYFLALEYIDGERVDQVLDRDGPFEWRRAFRMALDVIAADAAIYEKGFLYRDLKPENIILDRSGRANLVDLGLCIPRDAVLDDMSEELVGSVLYIPPERVAGLPEDCRSEIYSLGMVLFHLLTGQPLFSGDDPAALAEQHVREPRITACRDRLPEGTPEAVRSLLIRMVPRRRDARIASFDLLEEEIRRILAACPTASEIGTA
ncbi:MAG: serine/threonine protein kinase [Kiritimatiellaeota bacterium]|nr:serine/threonine protein kinase [Kiritimatiellota bacterium]